MRNYDICVKGMCTYTIEGVETDEEAIIQAIDYFCDDDEFWGTPETENVTKDDCEIIWFEEY